MSVFDLGILRNGTRIKWTPDIRVHNESSLSEEESVVFEEKDGFWFRETIFEAASFLILIFNKVSRSRSAY
jgi:hypothetical protein